jgi:hypothetical protein
MKCLITNEWIYLLLMDPLKDAEPIIFMPQSNPTEVESNMSAIS